ncbi:MAG: bifunctional 4-hydroxy-3-methylbut-2-enyl diphosphate reductase/30S ribosomal protein S1 [Bacillota bacterium]|jgi:small subunit ribosomal protein S1
MEVIVSKYAGFCPGVKRAVDMALQQSGRVATLGPLVHNAQMIEYLADKGIRTIDAIDDAREDTIIIRSHGVSPAVLEALQATGKEIVDATCPFVSRIHAIVGSLENRYLIIVGDASHPEVQGILGRAPNGVSVIDNVESALQIHSDLPVTVVVQTTFDEQELEKILAVLREQFEDLEVHNTICPSTRDRQREVAELARKSDVMLVIGGKNSANTGKLVAICMQSGVATHHIQSVHNIDPQWFANASTVGIAAGASTPEWIIREVVDLVMETNNEGIEEVKNDLEADQEVAEEAADVESEDVEEAAADVQEAVEDSNEFLETEPKPLAVGDIVVGKVVQVNPDEVLVDVGYKLEGIIRKDELSFRKVETCSELIAVGAEVEAEVTRLTEDLLELSARKLTQSKAWKTVREAFDNQTPVSGQVVEVVKGGLIVDLGLRAFMPASLVDLRFVEDLSQFVGQTVDVLVIELERRRNKVIVSRKAQLMRELEEKKAETLANLKEDTTVKGIVRRLTSFGAFVDIGGIDGLIHISELAHHRVEHPSEVLQEDQEIEVYVLKVDPEAERVSLSLKKILPDPWTEVARKFKVGDEVEGKVVRLADFGAFVELIPGVDGLVHVSQISDEHVDKPSDVLSTGQIVKVHILDIDVHAKRVSLSMREAARSGRRAFREEAPQDTSIGATIGERLGNLFDDQGDE